MKQIRSLILQDRIFRNEEEDQERKKERIYADTQIRGTRRKSQMRTRRRKGEETHWKQKGGKRGKDEEGKTKGRFLDLLLSRETAAQIAVDGSPSHKVAFSSHASPPRARRETTGVGCNVSEGAGRKIPRKAQCLGSSD